MSREQGRDKALRAKKRHVQVVHEHFELVLTVQGFTKRSRL